MNRLKSVSTIGFGLIVGQLELAALANESSLILPEHKDAHFELALPNVQADINPAEVIKVFTGRCESNCDEKYPLAGRYRVDAHKITFKPAFDLIEGKIYTVVVREFRSGDEAIPSQTEFRISQSNDISIPRVTAVYPSGYTVPENTLRFYIHFSAPMQPNVSTDFIKLVNSVGTPDAAAFMKFKQELWSEDRKRLTLLVDPGRIKRGVSQNVALGPALIEGNNYSIVIDEGWPSASGTAQLRRFKKSFSVTHALRTRPSTDFWRIESPRKSTHDPLVIHFDRPFDYQLSRTRITVLDELGNPVVGTVSVDNHERTWRFSPQKPWRQSKVQVTIDAHLEDVAGNNFKELLDHLVDTESHDIQSKTIVVKLNSSP